ncbi:MAG: DNA mismatch repair protein MutS [Bacteroidota bacterium]
MKFLPLLATIITIIWLLSKNYSRSKKNKRLEELRRKWGFLNNDYYNFDKIEKYAKLNTKESFHTLTDQTKSDIDFNELFTFIDRTTSKPGQQYLFDKLSKPTSNVAALQQMDQQIIFFTANQEEREEAQMLLAELNDDNAYHIASLLSNELPEKPAWFNLVIGDIIVTIVLIALSFRYPVLLAWLMVPLAVNLALHYWNKNNTFYFATSLPQLNRLVNICKTLKNKNLPFDNDAAGKSIDALKKFQRIMRLLGLRQSNLGGDAELIVYYVIDLVKAFFLIELVAYLSLIKDLKNKQSDIHNLFRYAGAIDAAISIASLRAAGTKTCLPVFISASKKLQAEKIYHPLIEDCVPNDIDITGRSILITGSNMSGKTTFLRTIAINAVFAQTIYTCFAESYQMPVVKLFSSIRIDDSLPEGKSYYFEEVNIMGTLVNEVKSGHQDLFILDEVFKGTNTVERIASGKAILSYLNKSDNLVFVSTHDIELSDMLKSEYDLYHFEENITNDQLQFDHKLKAGQLKTRNAIKILEISAYPAEIIDEANAISKKLRAIDTAGMPGNISKV